MKGRSTTALRKSGRSQSADAYKYYSQQLLPPETEVNSARPKSSSAGSYKYSQEPLSPESDPDKLPNTGGGNNNEYYSQHTSPSPAEPEISSERPPSSASNYDFYTQPPLSSETEISSQERPQSNANNYEYYSQQPLPPEVTSERPKSPVCSYKYSQQPLSQESDRPRCTPSSYKYYSQETLPHDPPDSDRPKSLTNSYKYYPQDVPPPPEPDSYRSRSPGGSYSKYYSYRQSPSETTSERSFTFDAHSLEEFINRNNNNSNYRASNGYSNDSIPGISGVPSNVYGKDVLPLPIEIPDNVADAEAFRRYLSVRRGAITPVRQQNISFEKRNQSCASYESIGKRSKKAAGLTPSGQLGQDASRRTSSLSHAIMTLALLSASICQLRFLLTYSHAHTYPILNYFLVFTSIILEVAAGIGYILVARCNYDDTQSEAIHNYLIFALFIVAVSNVILAAFAFDDHICDEIKNKNGHASTSVSAPVMSQQDLQFNQPVSRGDGTLDLRYMPLE